MAYIHSVALDGISVTDVEVQVHIAGGLPAFTVVGLPDKAVAESRERVRVAIQALGLALPAKRITVNLSPADMAKEGSHFDLPIALGLLVAMEIIPQDAVYTYITLGELALDGRIMPVSGVLPAAMGAVARDYGMICPAGNAGEAQWAGDIEILAPDSLSAFINHVRGEQILQPPTPKTQHSTPHHTDLSQVKGQHHARRALEITAAGGHNLLMCGPPGTGKSLLASCLPGILPPLSSKEMLDISIISSIAGTLPEGGLVRHRPYRAPHHSASLPAMIGGGKRAKPGDISLAHHGVLFLDELPEFPRALLEALRQPLETREISISRAHAHVTYPADFQLVAAMNPCRCGYLSDVNRACSKAPRCGADYQAKLSGPLLDRFDIYIDVPTLEMADMFSTQPAEASEPVRARVESARMRQTTRYAKHAHVATNAHASQDMMDSLIPMDDKARHMLHQAAVKLSLSMRGVTRVTRVAATIADLGGVSRITEACLAEALSYRPIHTSQHVQLAS